MYVTGQALDLAYALHGLSLATEKGEYAITMAKRAKAASLRLKKVAGAVSLPEIQKILVIADKADLKLNNKGPLSKAAEQVAASAKKFSESNDGSGLAAVDSLIPSPDKYRGSPP